MKIDGRLLRTYAACGKKSRMRNLLYGVAAAVVISCFLAPLGVLGFEFARAARWLPSTGEASQFGEWLVRFTRSPSYVSVLTAAIAFSVGVAFDWVARRADGSRFKFYAELSTRLESERERLVNIARLDAGPDLDNEVTSEMVRAYMDQIPLQKTLQDLGFKVPWLTWEEGTGMGQYLSVYTSYFAVLSTHLKARHIREAKVASKRIVDWGSGKSPHLKLGGDSQRLY